LDRGFLTAEEFNDFYQRAIEISSLLQKLIDYLDRSEMKGAKYKRQN
jgi:hypothetical protein